MKKTRGVGLCVLVKPDLCKCWHVTVVHRPFLAVARTMSFFGALGENGGGTTTTKKKRKRQRKKRGRSNKQTAQNPASAPSPAAPAPAPKSSAPAPAPAPAPAATGNKWDDIVDVISQIHKAFSKSQIAAIVEKLAKDGKDWKNVNTVVSALKATVHKFFDL